MGGFGGEKSMVIRDPHDRASRGQNGGGGRKPGGLLPIGMKADGNPAEMSSRRPFGHTGRSYQAGLRRYDPVQAVCQKGGGALSTLVADLEFWRASDADLVDAIAGGSDEALDEVYRRHAGAVRAVARRPRASPD